jgi:hypothetical protein
MATTPNATVSVSAEASAAAGGTGYCVVISPVSRNADTIPRVFANWRSLLTQHNYAPGVAYGALHIERTRKPVLFVGIPIVTAGALGRTNSSGVTGSCVISVAAGSDGYLDETDCILVVTTGGTIGTDNIRFNFSADGGRSWKQVRLGTDNSYTVPYLGIVISFGAGTLAVDDEFTFTTTAPKPDADGIAAARVALANQQKQSRTWLAAWDVATDTEAGYLTTAINAYETSNKRFSRVRANVRDRLPSAEMSRTSVRMTGSPTLTFAEVGATGDTITRSAGSFITDGFAVGMYVTVSGSSSNNVSGTIASLTDTVITFGTTDLANEGPVSNCAIVGSHALTFAEVGATGDTITRSGGSWLDDGFRDGDLITVEDTVSNNIEEAAVTSVTDTVITLGSTDLAAETIGSRSVTITAGETMADWVSEMESEFDSVDSQKRISLGLGRLRTQCPITQWLFRRPVSWAASVREYQHDIHRTTWAVADGPLQDWSMEDDDGNIVEFNQDTDGGGIEARFTCARTWPNQNGAYIACDLTRDVEGSDLSLTHNVDVANLMCTIVQSTTQRMIGLTPPLKSDGTMQSTALELLEESVNSQLDQALLREHVKGEGQRASIAKWTASKDDDLSVVPATLTGEGDLMVNGTIFNVDTNVGVR